MKEKVAKKKKKKGRKYEKKKTKTKIDKTQLKPIVENIMQLKLAP